MAKMHQNDNEEPYAPRVEFDQSSNMPEKKNALFGQKMKEQCRTI